MENIKGFTKNFTSGDYYMTISNETPMTSDGKTYCKFDLIKNKNSFWGCPVDQFGTIEEILEVLKRWVEINNNIKHEWVREMYKDKRKTEEEFIKILENELAIK